MVIKRIKEKMNLQKIKDKYIQTELAQKLYSKLKEIRNNDNFATGVVVNCETDENIQKMLNFIEVYILQI